MFGNKTKIRPECASSSSVINETVSVQTERCGQSSWLDVVLLRWSWFQWKTLVRYNFKSLSLSLSELQTSNTSAFTLSYILIEMMNFRKVTSLKAETTGSALLHWKMSPIYRYWFRFMELSKVKDTEAQKYSNFKHLTFFSFCGDTFCCAPVWKFQVFLHDHERTAHR